MRALDEPRRPQTIHLEVALDRSLDEARLRTAISEAVDRHPMARARQLPAGPFDSGFTWQIDDGPQEVPLEARDAPDAHTLGLVRNAFYSEHIDTRDGPPFRVVLVRELDVDRVFLSVTHVAFDGVGALRLLQSISRAYTSAPDPVPDVDPLEAKALLENRASGPGDDTRANFGIPQRPARLAASSARAVDGYGILNIDLDESTLPAIAGATVNDVLLAALHMAVAAWNHGHGAACERVTVMMPVNQRPAEWRSEVLANLVLAASVDSTSLQRATPSDLLSAIATQTRSIKANGVGGGIDPLPRRTPVLFRRLLPRMVDAVAGWAADTAILSNLGRVDDPPWFGGNGRGLWFSPPPRMPVVLTVGAATAGDRLGLSLCWCNSDFTESDAQAFADSLIEGLSQLE